MALPGWNNPSFVQSIHSSLEGAALLFFAALVLFDVMSHFAERASAAKYLERFGLACFGVAILAEIFAYPYSRRNDELTSMKIAELNLEADKAMERASLANERANKIAKDSEGLKKQAEDERLARARIEKSMEWRHLSNGAQRALCAVSPAPDQDLSVVVVTNMDDPEPKQYAIEFADAIGVCAARKNEDPRRGGMGAMQTWPSPMRFGVWLQFSREEFDLARSLAAALKRNGVDIGGITTSKARQRAITVWPKRLPTDESNQ
jgi:hypothetical protein